MASLEEIRLERLKKIERLRQEGINPYPIDCQNDVSLTEAVKNFTRLKKRRGGLTLAGRILAIRHQGGVIFGDIDDGTASFQILLRKNKNSALFQLFAATADRGDFIEVSGKLVVTKKGEKTLEAASWRMLAKTLRPLPDKWSGLQDTEERFRRRYLDSLMSPEVKRRFLLRSRTINLIRDFLNRAGFVEMETPVLQPVAGGANAEPFLTHHQALDANLYLRISEELYLKRLLVGGFPRVYSLAKNFRNEGVDVFHNSEFTMLEWYRAYSNAAGEKILVEKFIKTIVKKLLGKLKLTYRGQAINLEGRFRTITFFDLLRRHALIVSPETAAKEELQLRASQLGVAASNQNDSREKILDAIYKKICRPKIIQPTFIVDYPKNYLPLAKKKDGEGELVDAFQLVVGGLELAKAFSELNDPLDQRERFLEQEKNRQKGDKEAHHYDQDFLEALEYGMPPAGGVGIGVDRLMMLLTDASNIREVIFFPILRPKE